MFNAIIVGSPVVHVVAVEVGTQNSTRIKYLNQNFSIFGWVPRDCKRGLAYSQKTNSVGPLRDILLELATILVAFGCF